MTSTCCPHHCLLEQSKWPRMPNLTLFTEILYLCLDVKCGLHCVHGDILSGTYFCGQYILHCTMFKSFFFHKYNLILCMYRMGISILCMNMCTSGAGFIDVCYSFWSLFCLQSILIFKIVCLIMSNVHCVCVYCPRRIIQVLPVSHSIALSRQIWTSVNAAGLQGHWNIPSL